MIPASDRIVRLDHNSAEYQEALEAIDATEKAISEANDYDDPEDKEQRASELSAGRMLLHAARVRADAFIALVYRVLTYLAKKFADNVIGVAAKPALAVIGKMTGLW